MKNLSVLAIPAKENRKDNPYNYILSCSLEKQDVTVLPYSFRRLLHTGAYDIVHLHWPENFLSGKSFFGTYKACVFFLCKLLYWKLSGKKLVWTVHNFQPHEQKHPRLYRVFYRLLYRYIDGFISLTEFGKSEILRLRNVPLTKMTVVPHPHYKAYYPNQLDKENARRKLGIPEKKFVFLFLGQVRAYKNVLGLVDAFKKLNRPDAMLVIAGKIHAEMKQELGAAVAGTEGIKVFPQFIEDNELQTYLNAADIVVNPFNRILNSGSVFLNLSFARPTLVPNAGSLWELQQQVGTRWVKTFEGKLNAAHLEQCMEHHEETATSAGPDLSRYDWETVGTKTKDFYRRVLHK